MTRILIVDDEPVVRMTLKYALDDKKFVVMEVDSAEAALALTRVQRFDAYLLDKNLGGMSGVDLAKHLRERDQRAAILLVTGYATVDSAIESMNAGVDGYLEKPFDDIGRVQERLKEALLAAEKRAAAGVPAGPARPLPGGIVRVLLATGDGEDCQAVHDAFSATVDCNVERCIGADALLAALGRDGAAPDITVIDEQCATGGDLWALIDGLATGVRQATWLVAIKSRPSVDDADRGMRLGVKLLLTKPLVRATVDEKVAELFAQRRPPDRAKGGSAGSP